MGKLRSCDFQNPRTSSSRTLALCSVLCNNSRGPGAAALRQASGLGPTEPARTREELTTQHRQFGIAEEGERGSMEGLQTLEARCMSSRNHLTVCSGLEP